MFFYFEIIYFPLNHPSCNHIIEFFKYKMKRKERKKSLS